MQKLKIWLLFLLVGVIFYGSSLRYGFSQDDYYFLLISQAESLRDVINFFSPSAQQGFPFYRPLGTQLYFYLSVALTGLKNAPYFMHLFMLIIQSLNAYLAYLLVTKLSKDKSLAIWIGVLYVSSAAHFLSLFYISATQQLLSALFGLISLNLFLNKRRWLAAVTFFLALLSKENAVVIPALAYLLYLLQTKKADKIVALIKTFLPYALFALAYIALRLSTPLIIQAEYQPVLGLSLLNTLKWYFLFAYSAPEILLSYGPAGLLIDFPQFIRDFGIWALVSTLTLLTITLSSLLTIAKSFFTGLPLSRKNLIIYLSWWLISIILVIWYPDHRYPHYLDVGLIPLLLLIMQGTKPKWRNILGVLLLLSSAAGILLSLRSHWTVKRAAIARRAVSVIEASGGCQKDSLVFTGQGRAPQELSYVLSLANGPRLICDNPTLDVYYLPAQTGLAKKGGDVTIPEDVTVINIDGLLQ